MTAIVIRPGRTPLADWRAVLEGSAASLDPLARIDIEAGHAALASIMSGDGALPPPDLAAASAFVADLIEGRGTLLPEGERRLFLALKLASLAQGTTGARWEIVERMEALLAHDLLPAVPESASDGIALLHLFSALTGAGEIVDHGQIRPAADALHDAGLRPLALEPRERGALLSGNALTLAGALAALFAAEHILQATIVAAAFTTRAGGLALLHPSVHRLHRQRGQMEVAAALRALAARDDAAASVTGPNGDGGTPFRLGAALDLLRQAGALLERAANAVSEQPLVLWQSEEVVQGAGDVISIALAASLTATALAVLGEAATAGIAGDGDAAARATALAAKLRGEASALSLDAARIAGLRPLVLTASEAVALALLAARQASGQGGESAPADGDPLAALMRQLAEPADPAEEPLSDHALGVVAERIRTTALAASGVALPLVALRPRS